MKTKLIVFLFLCAGSIYAQVPLSGSNCVVATGQANAYGCFTTTLFTPLNGTSIDFRVDVANTGPSSLNVNGSGAYPINKQQGTVALASGDLAAGSWNSVTFDGSVWQLRSQTATGGGLNGVSVSGTPSAGQVPVATSSTAATWGSVSSPVIVTRYTANYSGSTLAGSTVSAAITITTLPAFTMLLGQRLTVVTQFAASGLTSALCSLGDSGNQYRYSGGKAIDASLAVTSTSFIPDGGFFNSTLASNAIVLYINATGANLSALTQGQLEVELATVAQPTSSITVQE